MQAVDSSVPIDLATQQQKAIPNWKLFINISCAIHQNLKQRNQSYKILWIYPDYVLGVLQLMVLGILNDKKEQAEKAKKQKKQNQKKTKQKQKTEKATICSNDDLAA